jgi:hypothetical protein
VVLVTVKRCVFCAVQTERFSFIYINFTLTFNTSAATIFLGIDKVSDIRQNPGLPHSPSTDEDKLTVTVCLSPGSGKMIQRQAVRAAAAKTYSHKFATV